MFSFSIFTVFSIEISDANSVDPGQMLHLQHLHWVCTVCIIPQNRFSNLKWIMLHINKIIHHTEHNDTLKLTSDKNTASLLTYNSCCPQRGYHRGWGIPIGWEITYFSKTHQHHTYPPKRILCIVYWNFTLLILHVSKFLQQSWEKIEFCQSLSLEWSFFNNICWNES